MRWLLIIFFSCFSKAEHIFTDDMKNGVLDCQRWNCDRCPQLKASSGKKPIEFPVENQGAQLTLSPQNGQILKGTYRCEIADRHRFSPGETAWYRFRIKVPVEFQPAVDKNCILAQIHDQNQLEGKPQNPELAHKPPIALRLQSSGALKVTLDLAQTALHEAQRIELVKIKNFPREQWVEFAFRIDWTNYDLPHPVAGRIQILYRESVNRNQNWRLLIDERRFFIGNSKWSAQGERVSWGAYLKVGPYCGDEKPKQDYKMYLSHFYRAGGLARPFFMPELTEP